MNEVKFINNANSSISNPRILKNPNIIGYPGGNTLKGSPWNVTKSKLFEKEIAEDR